MGVVNPLTREQAAPEVQEVFDKIAERTGKMPNKGTVEAKYKELAYLRASMVNGCEYCTRAHSASSKRAGVTAEQIAALPFYKRSPLFDEKEKATILYADRVTRAATTIRAAELEDLRKFYDEGQIVELTLAVCMANFTNRFNDALENIPDLGV